MTNKPKPEMKTSDLKKSSKVQKFMAKYRYTYHKEMSTELCELIIFEHKKLLQGLLDKLDIKKVKNITFEDWDKDKLLGYNQALTEVTKLIKEEMEGI